jgi:hypothetical protein
MGLLEDAIREHLELKRLRGADPAEVAREQHEALEPPPTDNAAAPADDPQALGEQVAHEDPHALELPADDAPAAEVPAPAEDHPGDPHAQAGGEFSNVGQETAELDMLTVLHVDPDAPAPPGEEDSLEWEVPGDHPRVDPDSPAPHAGPPAREDSVEPISEHSQPPEQGRLSL